jgi:hypothetical protein
VKRTSISLFRINAADKDRQGWTQESNQRIRWNSTSPLYGIGSPIITGRLSAMWLRRQLLNTGGERGIRTPDTRKGIHAFEARAFSHSAISPRPTSFIFILSGKLLPSDFAACLH